MCACVYTHHCFKILFTFFWSHSSLTRSVFQYECWPLKHHWFLHIFIVTLAIKLPLGIFLCTLLKLLELNSIIQYGRCGQCYRCTVKAAVFSSSILIVLDGLYLPNWHMQCSLILGMEKQTQQLLDFLFKLFQKEVAYL